MQIDERTVGNVTVLDLKGTVVLNSGDVVLRDKINSLVHQDRLKILLNLGAVPYIDSAGLGEIVRTYTTVSRRGGQLKLVHLTKPHHRSAHHHEAIDRLRDVRLGV